MCGQIAAAQLCSAVNLALGVVSLSGRCQGYFDSMWMRLTPRRCRAPHVRAAAGQCYSLVESTPCASGRLHSQAMGLCTIWGRNVACTSCVRGAWLPQAESCFLPWEVAVHFICRMHVSPVLVCPVFHSAIKLWRGICQVWLSAQECRPLHCP